MEIVIIFGYFFNWRTLIRISVLFSLSINCPSFFHTYYACATCTEFHNFRCNHNRFTGWSSLSSKGHIQVCQRGCGWVELRCWRNYCSHRIWWSRRSGNETNKKQIDNFHSFDKKMGDRAGKMISQSTIDHFRDIKMIMPAMIILPFPDLLRVHFVFMRNLSEFDSVWFFKMKFLNSFKFHLVLKWICFIHLFIFFSEFISFA